MADTPQGALADAVAAYKRQHDAITEAAAELADERQTRADSLLEPPPPIPPPL